MRPSSGMIQLSRNEPDSSCKHPKPLSVWRGGGLLVRRILRIPICVLLFYFHIHVTCICGCVLKRTPTMETVAMEAITVPLFLTI